MVLLRILWASTGVSLQFYVGLYSSQQFLTSNEGVRATVAPTETYRLASTEETGDYRCFHSVPSQKRTSESCFALSSVSCIVNKKDSETIRSCSTCHVYGMAPARCSHSCENPTSYTFARCCEDGCRGMECQSPQCCSEHCPTCNQRNMSSGLPSNFIPVANSTPQREHQSTLKNIHVSELEMKCSRSLSRESGAETRTAEAISEGCKRDPEEAHNGSVLAYSLAIGLGCVLLSSIWSIMRLLPIAFIPVIYLNRKTLFGERLWPLNMKAVEESTTELFGSFKKIHSDHTISDEQTLRDRMTALESQNEQLLRELDKQKKTTDLLLKQMEEFTPRTCTTSSKIEVCDFPDRIFED